MNQKDLLIIDILDKLEDQLEEKDIYELEKIQKQIEDIFTDVKHYDKQ